MRPIRLLLLLLPHVNQLHLKAAVTDVTPHRSKKTKPSQHDVTVWFDIAAAAVAVALVSLAGSQKPEACFDEMVARHCF